MLHTNKVAFYVTERLTFFQNLNGLEFAGTKMCDVHTLLVTAGQTGRNTEGKVEVLVPYCLPSSAH